MTSLPSLILEKGTRRFDLNDRVRCFLRPDFVPPETAVDALIATGSQGEARLYERVPKPRTLTFSVRIVGSSAADVAGSARLLKAFMVDAGDEHEPLYAAFKASNDTPEPLWGQFGAAVRYEILSAKVELGNDYMRAARRARAVIASLTLTIKPYAQGKQQRLGSALGGVMEDRLGVTDGRSRGLILPEATINHFTNPVFGHATYSTNWSIGANLIATYIADGGPLPGMGCVRITSVGATNNLTQSLTLTAVTYTQSFYVRRPDGGALSTSVINGLFASAPDNLTFTAMRNGWYRATVSANGRATAESYGCAIASGYTVDVAGFQIEALDRDTPLCYGDLIGCAWSSTEHESASARTAARWKISTAVDTLQIGAWTIRVIVKTPYANTVANSWMVFDARDGSHTTAPYCYYNQATDRFVLIYSANLVESAVLTFAAGATFVIYAVCTGTQITLYVNGVASSTSVAFTPATLGAALFIGSDYLAATQGNQTTTDLELLDVALSAGQVTADYAELEPLAAGDKPIYTLPWHWTKDGDAQIDNYYDATHNLHSIVAGVPGSAPALTEMNVTTDENALGFNIYQALYAVDEPIDAADFFSDLSGFADAAALGGAAAQATLGAFAVFGSIAGVAWKNFKGDDELAVLIRARDAGSNLKLHTSYNIASALTLAEVVNPSLVPATYGIQLLTGLFVPYLPETPGLTVSLTARRSTGSALYSLDYAVVLPGKIMVLVSASNGYNTLEYKSNRRNVYLYNTGYVMEITPLGGEQIEFKPGKLNYLFSHVGDADTSTLTRTVTYNWIKITPRYELL